MGVPLTKGGNVSLSKQAPGLAAVTVGLGWQVGAGCELDASALLCDRAGKVLSDQHFVFFNNLSSPDGSVRHSGSGSGSGSSGVVGDQEQVLVDLARVPGDVAKIVFPVSIYEGAARGQNFGQLRGAHIRVTDQEGGAELARYDLVAGSLSVETAMVFGELYRRGAEWKFRAVGQGYVSGLAGIATDYGVDVLREAPGAKSPAPASVVADGGGVNTYAPTVPPVPTAPPVPSAPPVPTPTVVVPQSPMGANSSQPTGSSPMTCFFDPSHGPGTTPVTWSPQWGVPRQIQVCGGCAQRVQTTLPPYYTPPQPSYPQQGYPQQGYSQQGYPAPHADHQDQQGGRRFGTGALIGAGAAGLVGGALLNEAFSDDEPDVIVNNYYED
ncbi:TerD family protein [Streptomyces sp. NPDC046631]|uniref:TerD family protein n=1 Tax=unclassified Streptomyces TaxID=2593676 RepID=UPI0033F4D158